MSRTRVIRRTEEDCRAELEAVYAEHPPLRDKFRDCCGGCAETDLALEYGWAHPIVTAWARVEELRFLLGDDV